MDNFVLKIGSPKITELVVGDARKNAVALVNTTVQWAGKASYIPPRGEIIIYSDRNIIDDVKYPGIKIGDGLTSVVDLPFAGDDIASQIIDALTEHINDTDVHVTSEEKTLWNNKLNMEIDGETLIFNRD